MAAAAILLAAVSCSIAHIGSRPSVMIGGDWTAVLPRLTAWTREAPGRSFQVQDFDAGKVRVHPPLDSLILADAWRRAGLDHPMLRRYPPAPRIAGILCGENYIFYLRGNRIVGVEYRVVESNSSGGYRQSDEAIGEMSDAPAPSS